MTWYAVYQTTDGRLLSVGSSVVDPLPAGTAAKTYADRPTGLWDAATLAFTPAPAPPRYVTKTNFQAARFTQAERIAARASTVPEVRDVVALFDNAPDQVNLDDPLVIGGLDVFVQAGILAASRPAQIRA